MAEALTAAVPPDQLVSRGLQVPVLEIVPAPLAAAEQTAEAEAVECLVPDRVEVDF